MKKYDFKLFSKYFQLPGKKLKTSDKNNDNFIACFS